MEYDMILSKFPVKLRKFIRELWVDGEMGIAAMNPIVNLSNRKISPGADIAKGNSFLLDVPYAGRNLNWEVIFNDEDLKAAPDFDFSPDQFLADPDVEAIDTEVPSLANWDSDDPKSLVRVLKEFLISYKKFQIDRLQEMKYQRQQTEYTLLTGEMGIETDDIEVLIDANDNTHFLIAIKVDFDILPPYEQADYFAKNDKLYNPGDDKAMLKVSFNGNRVTASLQLSPRLEQIVGESNKFHIPPYNKDSGLIEYVPAVTKLITDKLEMIAVSYKLRNDYISALLNFQPNSVIEYDSILFHKATLLLQEDGMYAIVTVNLSKKFPQDRPSLSLTSIGHEKNGRPIKEAISSYNYNKSWSPQAMARNLLDHLAKAIPKFKHDCVLHQN